MSGPQSEWDADAARVVADLRAGTSGSDEYAYLSGMRGLLRVSLARVRGLPPSDEQADDMWSEVHRIMDAYRTHLDMFIGGTEHAALENRPDDRYRACWGRSVLQLLHENDRFADFGYPLDGTDLADVDDAFRDTARVGFDPPDEVPDGMPRSHWWWWIGASEE